MALLLDGKAVAAAMKESMLKETASLSEKGIVPTLAVVRLGENPADISYEKGAAKTAADSGVAIKKVTLAIDTKEDALLDVIQELNADSSVHGVLLFRPLPSGIKDDAVRAALLPEKDVDGITNASIAALYSDKACFAPCTAEACLRILDHYNIEVSGKRAVIIGRSAVVGKPAALLMLKRGATVTVCHSKTLNLSEVSRQAEIVIAAMGRALCLDSSYFNKGQYIIDVGINPKPGGGICGDVKFDEAEPIAAGISPVPGGVGAVTSCVLISHVVEAAKKRPAQN